jgi:hypothetical protein
MINPNDEKFNEGNVTNQAAGESLPSRPENIMAAEESELDSPSGAAASSPDRWAEGRERLWEAGRRTQLFLRENPVPVILGALSLGLVIGWALRHATPDDDKQTKIKTPAGEINWSFLTLPFLWPFFRSVKDRYEDSADSIKDGVNKLKKVDLRPYTKPIRKRWKAWRS